MLTKGTLIISVPFLFKAYLYTTRHIDHARKQP